jgi:hypothetical protein
VVDEPWPFPPHYTRATQPLAALDLLDVPDPVARPIGREVLNQLPDIRPAVCGSWSRPMPAAKVKASKRLAHADPR